MQIVAVGYQALLEILQLKAMPHYRASYIKYKGKPRSILANSQEIHEYSKSYAPKDLQDVFGQLKFALKYDGINLDVLALVFQKLDKDSLTRWIKKRPTSKYTRVIWFLYEMLVDEKLDIEDSKRLKHVDVLDEQKYFTAKPQKSSRHGVNNNLLGNKDFCAILRKTPTDLTLNQQTR